MKRILLLLCLAPSLFAQHEYIIPMIGSAAGLDADHYAAADVLNPTARTAHIRVTGVYPVYPLQCEPVVPAELAARSRAQIGFGSTCPVRQLAAITIESDEPLVVKSSITSIIPRPGCTIADVQQIDAGTAWVPFGAGAVTYGELDEQVGLRANLLLINPNAFYLRVRVELHRPEANASREETLLVAPHATILHPLAAVPMPSTGFPSVVSGRHDILVTADGRFWAGVSSITTNGGNHFEEGVALEP